ncbi:hypothetical protein [Pseudomonas sp. LB3P58]
MFQAIKSPAIAPGFSSSGYGFGLLERTMSILRGNRDRRQSFVEQPQVLDRFLELQVGLPAHRLIAIKQLHIRSVGFQGGVIVPTRRMGTIITDGCVRRCD